MRWKKKRAPVAQPTELRKGAEPGGELRSELAENMGDIVEMVKDLAHPPSQPAVRFQQLDHNLGSRYDAPRHGAVAGAHGDMSSHHDVAGVELDIVGGFLNALLQSGHGAVEAYRHRHKAVHGSASELPQAPSEWQEEQQRPQQTELDDDDQLGRPSPDEHCREFGTKRHPRDGPAALPGS